MARSAAAWPGSGASGPACGSAGRGEPRAPGSGCCRHAAFTPIHPTGAPWPPATAGAPGGLSPSASASRSFRRTCVWSIGCLWTFVPCGHRVAASILCPPAVRQRLRKLSGDLAAERQLGICKRRTEQKGSPKFRFTAGLPAPPSLSPRRSSADCTIGISEWRRSSRGGRAILLWADLTSLRCRRPVTAQPYLAENDQASAPELADSARERRFGMGCWSRPKSQMGFFGRTAEILSVIVHIRFRRCRFRAAGTRETCALPPNYALISPEGPGCPGIGFQL